MTSIKSIFDHLGGPAQVSRILNVRPSTAGEMKRREVIHVKYWPTLVAACKRRGIRLSYDDLVRLHTSEAA